MSWVVKYEEYEVNRVNERLGEGMERITKTLKNERERGGDANGQSPWLFTIDSLSLLF